MDDKRIGYRVNARRVRCREPIAEDLRFEILKRDGHRCVYCGIDQTQAQLEVDHVEPVSRGGLTVAENLVTACAACNAGKSYIPLAQSLLALPSPQDIRNETEQLREIIEASRDKVRAKEELAQYVCGHWAARMPSIAMPEELVCNLQHDVAAVGVDGVLEAIDVIAVRHSRILNIVRYYYGVIHRIHDGVWGDGILQGKP